MNPLQLLFLLATCGSGFISHGAHVSSPSSSQHPSDSSLYSSSTQAKPPLHHSPSPSLYHESPSDDDSSKKTHNMKREAAIITSRPPSQPKEGHYDPKLDPTEEMIGVVNKTGVTLWLGERQIYASSENTWKGNKTTYHAGIHVIVLHEHRFTVLQKEQFHTWQPAAHRMLVKMLRALQVGRIVVLIGVPDFTVWFSNDAAKMVVKLGSRLGPMATRGEIWVMVAPKGQPPLLEALITSRNASSMDVAPMWFSTTVPRQAERQCQWYSNPSMALRAEFCEKYEGYGEFCACQNTLMPNPSLAPPLKPSGIFELIPVAMVTAKRLQNVLRQVVKIWRNPGGSVTPITIFVDGYNPEAEMLGKILNVTVVFHDNPAKIGSIHRVNQHIKFALENIFKLYPKADKAIILEDDLDISPDFVSYFQQTALLMRYDKTVSFVNAYNYNAYRHTASDPARIYRVQSYPYYGWMTRRKVADRMVKDWAPMNMTADWDFYIRKYHVDEWHQVIIPEIPRTKHEGGGGVHVSGFEQEMTFQQRPLNTLPGVELNMIRLWEIAYGVDMTKRIAGGKVVNITTHPCDEEPVPRNKNETYIIYVNLTGEDDYEMSYKVLGLCMGYYHRYLYEHYHGTFSMKYFETPFIIISCPSSAFCWDVPPSVIYSPNKDDLRYAMKNRWRHSHSTAEFAIRVRATSPEEEFNLDNAVSSKVLIQPVEEPKV